MHTDFCSLIFSHAYCVIFQTLFLSLVCSLLSRPIFIRVVFCLSWYDTWSCGWSCFLLNEYVMLAFELSDTNKSASVIALRAAT